MNRSSRGFLDCPGSSQIKDPTLEYITCPYCGEENEIFTDELRIECSRCGRSIVKNRGASCIDWCSKAAECIGADELARLKGNAA